MIYENEQSCDWPVWIRLWIFSVDRCENRFEQISHSNGRSPVWVRWWISRYGLRQNAAGHNSQRNGRFPTARQRNLCMFIWFFICLVFFCVWNFINCVCLWFVYVCEAGWSRGRKGQRAYEWVYYHFIFSLCFFFVSLRSRGGNDVNPIAMLCQLCQINVLIRLCVSECMLFGLNCWLNWWVYEWSDYVKWSGVAKKKSIDGQQWSNTANKKRRRIRTTVLVNQKKTI